MDWTTGFRAILAYNAQPVTWKGYCLLCEHCGKIYPFLYGERPRLKRCKYCEHDMTLAGCIAIPTPEQPPSNAPLTTEGGSNATGPER